MGPIKATIHCICHPFTWSGRASPSEFWWFTLVYFGVSTAASIWLLIPMFQLLGEHMEATRLAYEEARRTIQPVVLPPEPDFYKVVFDTTTEWIVLTLLSIPPMFSWYAVLVRRLHDTGRSGWWYWICLVPFVGGLILLILLIIPSEIYKNQYGPRPGGKIKDHPPRGSDMPVVERNPMDEVRGADALRALRQSRMTES